MCVGWTQLLFSVNNTHSQNQYRHWRPGYLTGADNQSSMRFMGGMLANQGRRMLKDRNYWYTDVLQKCKIPVCVWMRRRRVAFHLSSTLHSSSIRPAVDKNQERDHPIVTGRKQTKVWDISGCHVRTLKMPRKSCSILIFNYHRTEISIKMW